MKKLLRIAFAIFLWWSGPLNAADVTVFAAASLTDVLKEIAVGYEKTSGDKIVFNLGASSTLARQIEEGAPVDIFFSADETRMDALEKKNLIVKDTRRNRLSNIFVIVVAAEQGAAVSSPKDLADPKIKRIALGDPKAVPIGVYAKEYLEKEKLWATVEPKVVATENVRAALAAVEAGNADASIVYRTDAALSKKVRVAHEVPREAGPKISYPVALTKEAKQPRAARKFLQHLLSVDSAKIFERFGFIIVSVPPVS
jgi:molybdate transport system substrate-binding protein